MKLFVCIFLFSLALGAHSQTWLTDSGRFIKQAAQGSWDMWRAYRDMREANYKNSDKYFHARGNYDAARRGPGGIWASEVISNGREFFQGGSSGRGVEDSRADQEANRHGRSGGDPNRYRPAGLDKKY
ncbi:serum amyloid A protein-like [Ornithorhynchus anatinus]|nr:serum amyloid A protein-like [Ornithorhynchus anatinus]